MRIKRILLKYIVGLLSPDEERELQQWLNEQPAHVVYFQKLVARKNYSELYALYKEKHKAQVLKIPYWKRYWKNVAVWLLPFIMATMIGYMAYTPSTEILPGSSKACLYLSNGTQLTLDAVIEPRWIYIAESQMAKNEKGIIRYSSADSLKKIKQGEWNILKTPKGGEYRIELPDGTFVRLNALSSLSYPTQFIGENRIVELEGEAYFEIAKDSLHPFIVKAHGLEIKQYGTKFSVNARLSQETTVVLEEGSIGVSPEGSKALRMITPGEIVHWCKSKDELIVRHSRKELKALTAWHHDRFVFDNEPLAKVLEQISLWYDVEVRFQSAEIATMKFTGNVGRYADIKALLDAIETTAGVCVKVENKQITLMDETIIN